MAGESGGELGASMLGVAMLGVTPGTFALEVSAGNVATVDGSAVLAFAVTAEASGAGTIDLAALLAFIAQADAGGVGTVSLEALLAFIAQIDAGGVGSVDLDAWLQMLHAQGALAYELVQIAGEERAIRFYNEYRALKPMMDEADVIANDDRAVTI